MKYHGDVSTGALLHFRGGQLPDSQNQMNRRVIGGFVVPLLLALLTSFVVFQTVRTYNRSVAGVTAASRTLGDLNILIKTVVDAETGMRGFAITGNETFLEPYVSSTVSFGVALSALRGALPGADKQESLGEVDALFERWQREVAGVVVQARRRTPLTFSGALRGSSTALKDARVAALRYELSSSPVLLSRAEVSLGEAELQLQRALSSGVQGETLTAVRAAAARLEGLGNMSEAARLEALVTAEDLDETLGQLATEAETAEASVTALIRAGVGKRIVDKIRARIGELSSEVEGTLSSTLEAGSADTQRTQWVAFLGPLFAALTSLLVILQGQQQLGRSVGKLGVVVKAVAAGQLERRLTLSPRDELRPLAENFNRMADRLSEREEQNAQLGNFTSTLQACKTAEEAYGVAKGFAPHLFGPFSGALYRVSESRNILAEVARWDRPGTVLEHRAQGADAAKQVYTPPDCWALRRGKTQVVDSTRGIFCTHASPAPAKSLCVPLTTQGEPLGVLYLYSDDPATPLGEATERFIGTVAEQLALAISNLRLRETLEQQSIRDPLTGLFNRRHLDETLDLELHRAARRGEPVSAVMFDVDHFKRYNDLHGHDAGDAVLRALGSLVQRHIRAGDVACRFGGEEFLLLQPGLSAHDALARAEMLRESVSRLSLEHNGVALGSITVSLGVATYPDHALGRVALLKRADEALYEAKRAGRDQVVGAVPMKETA